MTSKESNSVAETIQLACDGDFDEQYDDIVRCGVQAVDTNVESSVVPIEGFKER